MPALGAVLQTRYRIVRLIADGGMGRVYEATDQRLGNTVALKETFFSDAKLRKAFEREARLLAGLRHPALPVVSDHFMEEAGQFLVMQFIPGDDLATLLNRRGYAFSPGEVLPWAEQLLDALDYLHTQQSPIIHRDIKPQNMKLAARGGIVLLDFGLAKGAAAGLSGMSADRSILGYTKSYAPIEQIQGLGTDGRSDLYSLAATLYHLMTGEAPVDALTRIVATANKQSDPLRRADEINPHIPHAIADVLQKAMALNREERYASAVEMHKALREATRVDEPTIIPPAPEPTPPAPLLPPPVQPARKTRRLRWTITGMVVVLLIAAALMLVLKKGSEKPTETPPPAESKPVFQAQLRQTLTGHSESVDSVAFSPDGKTLASGSWDDTIKLWDAQTGELKQTLTGHGRDVNSVAFSPDDKTLASGSDDKTIKLWDAQTGELKQTLTGHSELVYSVVFSPDGKTLASGSKDNMVKLWDTQTGELKQTLTGHGRDVNSVAFSPDDKTLASGSDDKTIKLWDAQTGELKQTLTGHSELVYSVVFSPDGKTLASGSDDKTIKLWDTQTGKLKQTLTGHSNFVRSVVFSPDSKTLASGSNDNTIKLWDAQTGELKQTLTGHSGQVFSIIFSPDGKTLASGSQDNTIKLWMRTN